MNKSKGKHPVTAWGMRRVIRKKAAAAGVLTGRRISSLRLLLSSLNHDELKRCYSLMNGENCLEHVRALSQTSDWHTGEESIKASRVYLYFHGWLRTMGEIYNNNESPDEIIRWLAHNSISLERSVKEPHRFAAVLRVLGTLRKEEEYSSISHTVRMNEVGMLRWVFNHPERVDEIVGAFKSQSDPLLSPGMVECFYNRHHLGDEDSPVADGWEARTYIFSSINGSKSSEKTADALSDLTDDEAISIYWKLRGDNGYEAHEFIRDVFMGERDEVIPKYLKAYAATADSLHIFASQYKSYSAPYDQLRWVFYSDVDLSDLEGFKAAVEVTGRIVLPWTSAPSTRIGQLKERGILGTAYERPKELEKLIEIYQNEPERHYFSTELLDSHGALTDGVL